MFVKLCHNHAHCWFLVHYIQLLGNYSAATSWELCPRWTSGRNLSLSLQLGTVAPSEHKRVVSDPNVSLIKPTHLLLSPVLVRGTWRRHSTLDIDNDLWLWFEELNECRCSKLDKVSTSRNNVLFTRSYVNDMFMKSIRHCKTQIRD